MELIKKSIVRKRTERIAEHGKMPPQNKEAEEAVLAAVMIEQEAIHQVAEIIRTPEVFYLDAHQRIWSAVQLLYYSHSNIDLLTIVEQLTKTGELEMVGGPYYVAQLSNKVGSAAHIEDHARILVEKYIQRKIISTSSHAQSDAYADTTDVFELLDRVNTEYNAINMELNGSGHQSFADMVSETSEQLKAAANSGTYLTGVPTFSNVLDRQLLGMQKSNLIIIAARPAMGKTSVAWHIARNQAKNNIPIGFFSLEMSGSELIKKMLASEIMVDTKTVARGGLKREEWQRFDDAVNRVCNYPIYLNHSGGLTINRIAAISKSWVHKHGVQVIYVDYLGLIGTGDSNKKFGTREQEVSYISGRLKQLAKELNIPVVALSQLSRNVESRCDRRPLLSDLRESGGIEQDADIIIFPFRPEYYADGFDCTTGDFTPGLTELNIAKYRSGQIGTVLWQFDAQYSLFRDVEG